MQSFSSLLELLQKNDIEKEFVQLQRAHQQQQAVLKKYQARSGKISALEDTVRQQEKVFICSVQHVVVVVVYLDYQTIKT